MICLNAPRDVPADYWRALWTPGPVEHSFFTLEHVARGKIDQTYPLVLLARPHLTLDAWRDHCGRRSTLRGAGLLLAVDAGGCVRGLCSHGVVARAAAGVLEADIFVVAHPFDPQPIVTQMLDELERMATAAGCRVIEFAQHDFQAQLQRSVVGRSVLMRPSDKLGL